MKKTKQVEASGFANECSEKELIEILKNKYPTVVDLNVTIRKIADGRKVLVVTAYLV